MRRLHMQRNREPLLGSPAVLEALEGSQVLMNPMWCRRLLVVLLKTRRTEDLGRDGSGNSLGAIQASRNCIL